MLNDAWIRKELVRERMVIHLLINLIGKLKTTHLVSKNRFHGRETIHRETAQQNMSA